MIDMSKRLLVTSVGGIKAWNFIESLKYHDKYERETLPYPWVPSTFWILGTDCNDLHRPFSNADMTVLVPHCREVDNYLGNLNKWINEMSIDLLVPMSDEELLIVSDYREELESKTFLPNKATVHRCQDKLLTNELLAKSGVPVPRSFRVKDANTIEKALTYWDECLEYPLWLRAIRGAGSKAALPVITSDIAVGWMKYWKYKADLDFDDFMISEYLPGTNYAWQSIWSDGWLVTSACRIRLEYLFGEFTASGQSSSYTIGKSVHNSKVNEVCVNAVRAIDKHPNGWYCIDLKEDSNGVPCVTEVNAGRPFSTTLFFTRAGCNMPYISVCLGLGMDVPKVSKFNSVSENLYWFRNVDRSPMLVKGNNDWFGGDV